MARLPRYFLPGQSQHVIQRGNNRSPLFFTSEDYHFYKECLLNASRLHGCAIHAYVLMTNHVHLVATPEAARSLPRLMQSVGRRYVQYINYCYRRSGTLWEGRYKATLIDSERYLLTCYRYVEMNPVRAAMVSEPGQYPWSSYCFNAQGKSDQMVEPHLLYLALGASDDQRQAAYRQLFVTDLEPSILDEIRTATNKAWALGSDKFKDEIQAALDRRITPLPRGGARNKQKTPSD